MPHVERPRGTRDFRPVEMAKRRWLERSFRESAHRFGYREIQTPTFEHAELFIAKSGPNVLEETYEFKDKGDRHLMLRPELTAPVMRFYVNALTHDPKPLKLYYYGPCFRYEEPQEGRYREFTQFGVELIGPGGPEADAEVIAAAHACVKDAGLASFNLHVGHIGVLSALAARVPEEKRAAMYRLVDKDSDDLDRFLREDAALDDALAEAIAFIARHERRLVLGSARPVRDRDGSGGGVRDDGEGASHAVDAYFREAADAVKPAVDDATFDVVAKALAHVREILEFLQVLGITDLHVDLGVARGLDYYTGMVFELEAPDLGAQKQIGGGGAYTLAEVFGGAPIATSGFGLGFDRILLALEKADAVPAEAAHTLDAFVAPIGDAARVAAFDIATRLRREGLHVDVDLMRRKPGKNFDYANSVNARKVVVVGRRELEEGVASVKDMTTGDQVTVKLADLADALRA